MARVGVDLDGVCYDFGASVKAYLQLTLEDEIIYDFTEPTRWEFYEDWGLDLDQFISVCNAGVNAGVIFTHGDPHPGTKAALDLIIHAGHSIHIITDRSFGKQGASEEATLAWLDKHDLPYHTITFTADKTSVHVDHMVDDKPENYAALRQAGVDVWLFSRPWNDNVLGAKRVYSLIQYAGVVNGVNV